jgi:hypothetical protein
VLLLYGYHQRSPPETTKIQHYCTQSSHLPICHLPSSLLCFNSPPSTSPHSASSVSSSSHSLARSSPADAARNFASMEALALIPPAACLPPRLPCCMRCLRRGFRAGTPSRVVLQSSMAHTLRVTVRRTGLFAPMHGSFVLPPPLPPTEPLFAFCCCYCCFYCSSCPDRTLLKCQFAYYREALLQVRLGTQDHEKP